MLMQITCVEIAKRWRSWTTTLNRWVNASHL